MIFFEYREGNPLSLDPAQPNCYKERALPQANSAWCQQLIGLPDTFLAIILKGIS